jgi:hypothetical protein
MDEPRGMVLDFPMTQTLRVALDDCWRRAQREGLLRWRDETARDTLAKYLVELVQRGERDYPTLVECALDKLRKARP